MKQTDYESLSYRNKFIRALRAGVITLLIALLVVGPALWTWQMSVEKRRVFREAKNVVLNMNLLSPEFMAEMIRVTDPATGSGLSEEAEARVRSYSAAEGEIQLVAWDDRLNCAKAVNYRSGRYLVKYHWDRQEKKETWEIFFQTGQYESHRE